MGPESDRRRRSFLGVTQSRVSSAVTADWQSV